MDRKSVNDRAAVVREKSLQLLDYEEIRRTVSKHTTYFIAQEMAVCMLPSYDCAQVERLQQETAEGRSLLKTSPNVGLENAADIRQQLNHTRLGGILTGTDLVKVAHVIESLINLRRSILDCGDSIPIMIQIANKMPCLNHISHSVKSKIEPSGNVKDDATPALANLRLQVRESYERTKEALIEVVESHDQEDIFQDTVINIRNNRLVIPVKSNMRNRISGVVHDASNSGETLYMEPVSTIDLCNTWREFALEEERETTRILLNLSEKVGYEAESLLSGTLAAGEVDFIIAKARYSNSMSGLNLIKNKPGKKGVNDTLHLLRARHPLLSEKVVPLSLSLDSNQHVLVITGPNTGGKTVALKTVGLMAAMNQSGIHIPAEEGSYLPIFDGLFTDIGDHQDIENSLSSFSSHIKSIIEILQYAGQQSLVLIDEIGSSTDPEEGEAIAKAILEYLADHKTLTLATTHFHSLSDLAESHPNMKNASFHLDPETFQPTYQLSLGTPGRSYAITTASRIGLPEKIITEAQKYLDPTYKKLSDQLRHIDIDRKKLHESLANAREIQTEVQEIRKNLEEQLEYLIYHRESILDSIHSNSLEQQREIKRLLIKAKSLIHLVNTTNAQEGFAAKLESTERQFSEFNIPKHRAVTRDPFQFCINDRVSIRGLDLSGMICFYKDGDYTAEVLVGKTRMTVDVSRLTKIDESNATNPAKSKPSYQTVRPSEMVEMTLDIRGIRADPALVKTDEFLDHAIRDGLTKVLIIHGKGTGALRQVIRDSLTNHPLVASFGSETDSTGGDGATYVVLH